MAADRKAFADRIYYYTAQVVNVVDGDTLDIELDYGFHLYNTKCKIRLAHINAAEIHSTDPVTLAKAQAARNKVLELCPVGSIILVHTHNDTPDKYGRILADVWAQPNNPTISDQLLALGLVRKWDGKGEKPV